MFRAGWGEGPTRTPLFFCDYGHFYCNVRLITDYILRNKCLLFHFIFFGGWGMGYTFPIIIKCKG